MLSRKLFSVALAALLFLLCAREASACSCAGYTLREKFRQADAVFVGELLELSDPPKEFYGVSAYLARFHVERRWKGAKGREVTAVIDVDDPGMCGDLPLAVGKKYLIYAPRYKGRLRVYTDCGPNLDLKWEGADAELKRLDSFWLRMKARLYPYPKF